MIDFDATVLAAVHQAFGEQVTFLPAAGGSYTVSGVFDDKWVDDKLQDALDVVATRTVLTARLSQLPGEPAQGDQWEVRGRLYTIAEPPKADTYGDVLMFLRFADDTEATIQPAAPVAMA